MKTIKYPDKHSYSCSVCGSEFILTKRDYKNHKLSYEFGSLGVECPVCRHTVKTETNIYSAIKSNIDTIFQNKATQINSLPADTTRKTISHHLNDLYEEISEYLESLNSEGEGNV